MKFQKIVGLISLLICFLLVSCSSFSSPTGNLSNTELEQQVLQIIRDNPEVILESVQSYQQSKREEQKKVQQSLLQELKTNSKEILAKSPSTGAEDSNIILVEFSDFQCPYCARAQKTLKKFMAKHQDEVTLVYKHLPLTSIHPQAMAAAEASWAAGQQNKFWEYHDALFAQQKKLGEELYLDIAQTLNLDLEKFNSDRKIATTAIEEDINLARKFDIAGTPFFAMSSLDNSNNKGQTFSGAIQLSDLEKVLTVIKN